MQRDRDFLQRHDQYVQTDKIEGSWKAIVVDNRDPHMNRCCRVHIYNLHSDYKDLPVTVLPWAAPASEQEATPSRFDRVWVKFEGGDLTTLVYYGRWHGNPGGRGRLPHNSGVGTERRPEGWDSSDLVPESQILGMSKEGSGVWLSERLLGESKGVASSITLMDTGSKYLRVNSFHLDKEPWVPKESRTAEVGKSLEEGPSDPFEAIRDGISESVDAAGGIEMGFKNLHQALQTNEEGQTIASLTQTGKEDEGQLALQALDGQILSLQQKSSRLDVMGDAIFSGGKQGLLSTRLVSAPERRH